MKYKAIIADIDGTIAPVESKPMPSIKVKNAIYTMIQRGYVFTLATGKPFSLVEYLIDYLGLQAPVIIDNGAAIYNSLTKKPIIDHTINSDKTKSILEYIVKLNKDFHVSCQKENLHNITHIGSQHKVRKFVIHKILPQDSDRAIKDIKSLFNDLEVVKTSSSKGKQFNSIYITAHNATKQHAVNDLSRVLKISTGKIIGVGDHYNDLPLLMSCGFRIAMGNAVPEIKKIADYIAPPVEKDGIVKVINTFFPVQ